MNAAQRILVVEDDPALAGALEETLRVAELECVVLSSAEAALSYLDGDSAGLLITDVNLGGMDGFALLDALRHRPEAPSVIMMTAFGTIERAVQAMKNGAVDYLTKPFRPRELLACVRRHLPQVDTSSVVAVDRRSDRTLAMARKVAGSDATVLLEGESGTGKEVLARFIHEHSARSAGPFVALNCAAIPESLLESILFGHEKGAFSNAYQMQSGKFEQANGGTILLDEITEMSIALQAKLLRVLQEREVERIGGKQVIVLDVRVIATTNRDLAAAVRDGKFREDLFYRLSVFPIRLSPLRERSDDILPLAEHLLKRHGRKGGRYCTLGSAAAEALKQHPWPGNVRELDNVIQRALILCVSSEIDVDDLAFPDAADSSPSLDSNLRVTERDVITETLRKFDGHRGKAAEALGIAERTLRHKLAKLRDQGLLIED